MRILRGRARTKARGRAIPSSSFSACHLPGSKPGSRTEPRTGPALANAVDLYRLRHELRTPLTGMLGLAELLSAQVLPGQAAIWLATLQACGQQMANLIDRSLRPNLSGDTDAPAESGTEGGAYLEQLICSHWPAAKAGNTQLHLLLEPQARAYWRVEPVPLRQALDNLLANAVRFSAGGYVLLEARVLPTAVVDADTLVLAVENKRHGLSQTVEVKSASGLQIADCNPRANAAGEFDYADRSYCMFSRGLGLKVVEQVCDALQGQFHRSQATVEGARFELQFPAVVLRCEKQSKPFGINLLRSLNCLLLLEEPQRRVVAALLTCLDISFLAIDKLEETALLALPRNRLLICKTCRLPPAALGRDDRFKPQSICLLARLSHTDQPEWYVQVLSEPLLLVELQTALLRCLVLQGVAIREAQVLVE